MSVANDRLLLESLIKKYGSTDVKKFVKKINEENGADISEDTNHASPVTDAVIPSFEFKDLHIRYKAKHDDNVNQAGGNNTYDIFICDGTQVIFEYFHDRSYEGELGEADDFVGCIGGSPNKDAGYLRGKNGELNKKVMWSGLSQYIGSPWFLGFDAKEVETAVKVFNKFYPKSAFCNKAVWPVKGENPYKDWGIEFGVHQEILPDAKTVEPVWGCNPFWNALHRA